MSPICSVLLIIALMLNFKPSQFDVSDQFCSYTEDHKNGYEPVESTNFHSLRRTINTDLIENCIPCKEETVVSLVEIKCALSEKITNWLRIEGVFATLHGSEKTCRMEVDNHGKFRLLAC